MPEPFNPNVGDADKTYEYIAHQVEREDNLYQTRLATCVVVNLGLAAAVASQVSADIDKKTYIIAVGCCVIGLLVTEGIRFSNNAGQIQSAYLRECFNSLDAVYPGKFPCPFFHKHVKSRSAVVNKFKTIIAKLTPIALVFEAIWIGTFFLLTFFFLFYQS